MRATIAALLLSLAAGPAFAQSPREPYLQIGTPTSMTVVWRSDASPPPGVCYGAAPDALTTLAMGTATRVGAVDHIEVEITGLRPATRYYYAVGHASCPPSAAGSPGHHWTTSPTVGAATPFRFWVVGDSGTGGRDQRAVFDAMRAEAAGTPPDLFVHVGDMAYSDGTVAEFDSNFYAVYAPLLSTIPVWPAIGNHEGHSSTSATESGPYYDGYVLPRDGRAGGVPSGTEAYYSFDYSNVHFIVLDSYDSPRDVAGAMVRWLEMDLAATTQEWLIAYWHHPPYTDGSHVDSEGAQQDMRQQVIPVLEAAGVDLVLGGHSHIYERSYLLHGAYYAGLAGPGATAAIVDMGDGRPGGDGAYVTEAGDVYVVAGHGGTGVSGAGMHPLMAFSEVENGSCLVDVEGGVITLRNVRIDGAITDEVVLVHGSGIFVNQPSGMSYPAGSDIDVLWTSVGAGSGEVSIEYSLDDGAGWTTVIDRTADDGMFTWSSPLVATMLGRVRVTDVADAGRSGTSPRPFALSAESDVLLIGAGSVWEYNDAMAAPPADWATTTGGWASGPAQLGYGDGDEATVLLDADPNVPSAYFRQALTVAGEVVEASATVTFDDGFALLIDGVVAGSRYVDGGLDHDAFASQQSSDNEVATITIDPTLLGEGDRAIAVIVKQANGTSSDLSFDLSLTARVRAPVVPPPDGGTPGLDGGSTPDGSVSRDAGGADAGGDPGGDGCGCRIDAQRSGGAWWLAFGLAVLLSARSASRRRGRPRR